MKSIISTFILCIILTRSFGQTQKKVATYLLTQYTKTLDDRTIGNNPWGIGLGVQAFFNFKTKFKPTIELTADTYLEDDKVLRLNSADPTATKIKDVRGMINLLAGSSFQPTQKIYFSFVAGPSFISDQTLLAIKPSLGLYLSKNQRWTAKASYINVFNRDDTTKEDFSSISFAVGVKLF